MRGTSDLQGWYVWRFSQSRLGGESARGDGQILTYVSNAAYTSFCLKLLLSRLLKMPHHPASLMCREIRERLLSTSFPLFGRGGYMVCFSCLFGKYPVCMLIQFNHVNDKSSFLSLKPCTIFRRETRFFDDVKHRLSKYSDDSNGRSPVLGGEYFLGHGVGASRDVAFGFFRFSEEENQHLGKWNFCFVETKGATAGCRFSVRLM